MNFLDFIAAHGLIVEHLIEGRWVRVKTVDHPKKRNGAYRFLGDVGFVQNHATMDRVAVWRNGSNAGFMDRSELRARQAISRAHDKALQSEARAKAQALLERCRIETHPYLAAKGFPDELVHVLDSRMLVPMRSFRNYRQLNSVQFISAAGEKKFLTGGQAKGSVFEIGPSRAKERWLVEGFATALTVRLALEKLYREVLVIVCFSAGNVAYIGRLVKMMDWKAFVFADNDESGAGAKAAAETGLPWLMAPEVGMDANDWHQRHGIAEVAKLIRNRAHNPGPQAEREFGRRSMASGAFDREG